VSSQNVTNDRNDFCCQESPCCKESENFCDQGNGRFRVVGALAPIATIGSAGVQVVTSASIIPSASFYSNSVASSSTTSTQTLSSSSTTSIPTRPSSSALSIPIPSNTVAAQATGSNSVNIGIGVGIVGILVAIAVLVAAWHLLRRRTKTLAKLAEEIGLRHREDVPVGGRYEIDGAQRGGYEIDGVQRPAELYAAGAWKPEEHKLVYELSTARMSRI
jgi:hypothetical protein